MCILISQTCFQTSYKTGVWVTCCLGLLGTDPLDTNILDGGNVVIEHRLNRA